jgi:hypothetical protein
MDFDEPLFRQIDLCLVHLPLDILEVSGLF